jgi:hypothetical protein
MVLNIHLDVSCLTESRARNRLVGYFFLGSVPIKGKEIKKNGNIFVTHGLLNIAIASATEAELGALFLNIKEGKTICLMLEEMGHKQPPTLVHCDNSTAAGVANDTVKQQ